MNKRINSIGEINLEGIIIKETALKESHNTKSLTLAILPVSLKVEILKLRIGYYDSPWVYIQSQEGVKGYIRQEDLIELGSKYTLVVSGAFVFNEASNKSLKVFELPNKAQITITDMVLNENDIWYRVTDSLDRTGYMNSTGEIELTRELIDWLDKDKGGMIQTFANSGVTGGVTLIILSSCYSIYCYNSVGIIPPLPVLLMGIGTLAIILGLVRRKSRKKYE